jgi:2-oxoacid:acceptor oxidoreductase delta subunit (pyruvate/2-ketoisovalerate family)
MGIEKNALGPNSDQLFSYLEVPIGSVIIGADSHLRRTGQWRYTRPLLVEKISPCQMGCPLGTPIREVIELIRQKEYEEALKLIKEENPFPGICGRICYHPCAINCLRSEFDEPININLLERFVSDRVSEDLEGNGERRDSSSKRVAVIGGGPAGLSSAYFLGRMGYQVTLYEAMQFLGGMLRIGIPAYRLPRDVLNREIQGVLNQGVKVVAPALVGRDVPWEVIQGYDAVFVAIGNHKSTKLHIPGEEAEGVFSGIDFLRKVNMGGSISLGEKIAIIGGGNTAIDVARVVSRLESKPVILYRRDRKEMPAFEDEVREAEEEGIPIQFLTVPIHIHTEKGRVKGLECQRTILKFEGDGRSKIVVLGGSNFTIDVDTVICAIGEEVDRSYLPPKWEKAGGKIPIGPTFSSEEPGFFVGGDMVSQQKTVVHAIASGKLGAISIDLYLQGKKAKDFLDSVRIGQNGPISMRAYANHQSQTAFRGVSFGDINTAYFYPQPRPLLSKLQLADRYSGFCEVNSGLSEDQALEAANRCFHCGRCMLCGNCYIFCPDGVVQKNFHEGKYVIDYDYCKGCGICQNECPIGAIDMEVELEE